MYNLLEAVRLIALLVAPFLPHTGEKIMAILGSNGDNLSLEGRDGWGGFSTGRNA
jgi:methionyl-tRNA synthetase